MGEPGRFIWHELATTDLKRAKSFYKALMGWRFEAMKGAGGTYTVIHAGERGIGGMVPCGEGAPSQWTAYVSVDDVDAAVRRGESAVGKTLVPPTTIPTVGRFALMADPSGAGIMPFVPDGPDQPEPAPPPRGTVRWNELYTHDAAAALRFYQAVFAWGHGAMDMGAAGVYHLFKRAGKDVGGMMELPAAALPRSVWVPYFVVASVDDSLAKALERGATQRLPPHTAPDVGRFAIVVDPFSATFGLFEG